MNHRFPSLIVCLVLAAATARADEAALPTVRVSGVASTPVQKSYRKMVHGQEVFDALRARYAPQAGPLRFKLLPRKRGLDVSSAVIELSSLNVDDEIGVAPDHTFALPPVNEQALREDAVVMSSRKQLSMTWRTEIRTPGLPPDTRRLGDLRLECRVGLEADLVSNEDLLGRLGALFAESSESYCGKPASRYLFFAERPIFGVTLVDGARREQLPAARLWAGASEDPGLGHDLPYCDCEVLVDRSYFLPLGDASWSDETRVEFDYMDAGLRDTGQDKAYIAAALGPPTVVDLHDEGRWEVWLYRRGADGGAEQLLLFDAAGRLSKQRLRPATAR